MNSTYHTTSSSQLNQVHNGKSQTVNGSTRMYLGDMIHLVIPKSEIGKVKDLLL